MVQDAEELSCSGWGRTLGAGASQALSASLAQVRSRDLQLKRVVLSPLESPGPPVSPEWLSNPWLPSRLPAGSSRAGIAGIRAVTLAAALNLDKRL